MRVCVECDIVKCYIHYEYISQEISLREECLHKSRTLSPSRGRNWQNWTGNFDEFFSNFVFSPVTGSRLSTIFFKICLPFLIEIQNFLISETN